MRRFIALFVVVCFAASAAEDVVIGKKDEVKKPEVKAKDKEADNPFGVNLDGGARDLEKVLDPNLTNEESEAIRLYHKGIRDRAATKELQQACYKALEAWAERWCSGAEKWTAKDVDDRVKAYGSISDKVSSSCNASTRCSGAMVRYVAANDDANIFLSRLADLDRYLEACHTGQTEYKEAIALYFKHKKFEKVTDEQKRKFITGFVIPKIKKSFYSERQVKYLKEDMEDEEKARKK